MLHSSNRMSMIHGLNHGGHVLVEEEPPGDVNPQSWYLRHPESEDFPTDAEQDLISAPIPDLTLSEFTEIEDELSQFIEGVFCSGLQESEDNGDNQTEESEEGDDQSKEFENSGSAVPTADMLHIQQQQQHVDHGSHDGGDVQFGLNPEVPPGGFDYQSWGQIYQESDNHTPNAAQEYSYNPVIPDHTGAAVTTTDMLHSSNSMLFDHGFHHQGEVPGVPPGDVNHQPWYPSYQESDNHQVGRNQESDDYTTDSSPSADTPDDTVIESQAATQHDVEQRESIFDVVGSGLENGDDQTEESEEDAEGGDQSVESSYAGGDGDSYEAKINEDTVHVPWKVRQRGEKPQGVTFHNKNKVWEAHLWIKGVKFNNPHRNGKQVFLGCYKTEDEAKHAHDRAAIRLKKRKTSEREPYALNFPESEQAEFMAEFGNWSPWDFLWNLRRRSLSFSTGKCSFKGVVTRTAKVKKQNVTKFEAKISETDPDEGKRTYNLGRFDTEEDAAKAYDKALLFIKRHKTEVQKWHVISNFRPSSYNQDDIEEAGRMLNHKPT